MENQNEPLLIRPSRTPKTNPKKNFCSKSLPTMGASTWFLCVTFSVCLQNLCKKFEKSQEYNHVLAPILGKDLGQKFFLGFVLGVLEGLINKDFF